MHGYSWLLIASIAPLLWATANHIDKYLITKFGVGIGTKGLIIFSCLLSSITVIVVSFFLPKTHILAFPTLNIIVLITTGILWSLGILFYLFALGEDETSFVVAMFQLIPVFAFIMGFLFLGETISIRQIIGALIIILGGILVSLNFNEKFKFKKKLFILMVSSSFVIALSQILFKFAALDNFKGAMFWQYTGTLLLGLIFLCLPSFKKEFFSVFKNNLTGKIFFWSVMVEILTLIGNSLVSFSVLIAPVAMVLLVESFQPALSFILAIIITIFIPTFAKEDLSPKILFQKITAIAIVLIGSAILFL